MKITFKIGLLIAFVMFSLISIFSIPPVFLQKGLEVTSVGQNTTLFEEGLRKGDIIISIDNVPIGSLENYSSAISFLGQKKTQITTKNLEIISLLSSEDFSEVVLNEIPSTRLKTGLDIQGGARALVTAKDHNLTLSELDDLITISQERLNVYGLTDVQLRKVTDLSGSNFMLVEIAGSSPEDLENLIAKQGKFEAKIGNETVFTGGEDITYVGRTGQDAGITACSTTSTEEVCTFRFTIALSPEAAKRHADITSNLSVNLTSGGRYLEKQLDFYLDGILTNSLNIGADLKGQVATQIQISGSGSGLDREEAITNAKDDMKQLQTVLITGSLPFKLEIVKLDRISPTLGEDFLKHILLGGLFAMAAVFLIVLIRYRKPKISAMLILVSFSEVLIILGVAALIKWNLDLPSIAGIIATIGTGVDSQLVILDESRVKGESIKQRVKKALFIIATAFTTTFVALIPLTGVLGFMGIGAASAGLLKGFAVTTLIGITTGILITRPAFADIAKQLEKD